MKIDLHCHTAVRSSCSSLTPEALIELARAAGLDAICLTEHDRSWTAAEIAELRERSDFIVLRGMEVTTELGHVLVFGLEGYEPDMYFATNLRRHVRAVNGLMVLAHPARAGQPEPDIVLHGDLFDALEGLNGSDGPAQNKAAMRLGTRLALPPTAGSDCHSPREAGTVATVLAHPVATERELIAELRTGRHTTAHLNASLRRKPLGTASAGQASASQGSLPGAILLPFRGRNASRSPNSPQQDRPYRRRAIEIRHGG